MGIDGYPITFEEFCQRLEEGNQVEETSIETPSVPRNNGQIREVEEHFAHAHKKSVVVPEATLEDPEEFADALRSGMVETIDASTRNSN